ncbi:MAG: hypothetical protein Q8O12_06550 [Candidatus Omnitrophota bacterium]|nr:hypothetical protein [Candidatus Omnitrophota bacterium]
MRNIKILFRERNKTIVFFFFIALFCAGIIVFKDYGLGFDEGSERRLGIMTLDYVFKHDPALFQTNNFYGPVFQVALVGLERIFNLTGNLKNVYLMRHLATFLLFYTGVFFFYRLCVYRFKDRKMGLIGSLFLVLSPRIFADSFYNSRDIPFLSLFIISAYTLILYLENKTFARAFFHGLASAFLINIRPIGVIMLFLTIVFVMLDLFMPKSLRQDKRQGFSSLLAYIGVAGFFTVLFWPLLWGYPIHNGIILSKRFMHFFSDQPMFYTLYLGNYIKTSELPWHYIPVWIAISVPISYLVLFIIGCVSSIKSLRRDLVFILWFFLPLIYIGVSKQPLYDGWRHLFFIYPAFLMIALIGLKDVWMSFNRGLGYKTAAGALTIFIILNLANVARFMARYHPYQNIYFNILAGKNMADVKNKFELDYWGLSYRKALEYIVRNDASEAIKVYVNNLPGVFNSYMLNPSDRKRLVYVKTPDEARYFLSEYRWHNGEYPYKNEFYSIKINGAKIMAAYKL